MKRVRGVVEAAVWLAQQQAPICSANNQDPAVVGEGEEAAKADEVVALCTGTLFNLSSDPETSKMLMQRKWIRSVISIMKQSKMSRLMSSVLQLCTISLKVMTRLVVFMRVRAPLKS